MRRKQNLSQSSYSTRETFCDNFCVVCSINNNNNNNNNNNCDTLKLQQDVDLAQLFSIFCKYFKLNSSQFTNICHDGGNGQNLLSQFCSKCMELLEKLWSQDEQLNALQNDISRTLALLTFNILQQNTSTSKTSKSSQSGDRNNQNLTEKGKVTQIIRQRFSPLVVVRDLYKQQNSHSLNQTQSQSKINCNTNVDEEEEEILNDEIKEELYDDDDANCDKIESEVITNQKEKDEKQLLSTLDTQPKQKSDVQSFFQVLCTSSSASFSPQKHPQNLQLVQIIPEKSIQYEQQHNNEMPTTTTTTSNKIILIEIIPPPSQSEDFVDNLSSTIEIPNTAKENPNIINSQWTAYPIKQVNGKFLCPIVNCNSRRKSKSSMKIHLERVHGKERAVVKNKKSQPKVKKRKLKVDIIPRDPENLNDDEEKELTINMKGRDWRIIKLTNGKFKCPFENCEKGIRRTIKLVKIHMNQMHNEDKATKKKRTMKINWTRVKTSSEPDSTKYKCKTCDELFDSSKIAYLHYNSTHVVISNESRANKYIIIPPDPENLNDAEEKELLINMNGRDWRIDKLTNGKFKCPFENCAKGIRRTIKLVKSHMNQIHNEDEAAKKQRTIQKSWTRVKTSPDSTKYKCNICDELFNSAKLADFHYNSTHVISNEIREKISRASFTKGPTPGTFYFHKNWLIETITTGESNSDGNAFRCRACQLETKTQNQILGHITDVHMNSMTQKSKLVCPVCNYSCLRGRGPTYFLGHMSRHWTDAEMPELISVGSSRFLYKGKWFFGHHDDKYKCFECHFERSVFSSQEEMLQHLEGKHSECLICEKCGEKFRSVLGLHSHMLYFGDHSNLQSLGGGKFTYIIGQNEWPFEKIQQHFGGLKERSRFKCGTCSSKMWDLMSVKRHMKDLHEDPKSFVCEICGKTLTSGHTLQDHIKIVHSDPDVFPFTCSICQRGFKIKKRLKNHEQKHQEWRCPNCNKIFQYRSNVQNHLRKHCSGVEGNNCPRCHVYFKRKDSLQLHIDSGECTGNSSNSSKNRGGKKLPRKRKETISEESEESSSEAEPKRKKTEAEKISSTLETLNNEEQELATELWTFGIDQNQIEST